MNQLLIQFPLLQVREIAKDFHGNRFAQILKDDENRPKFPSEYF